MRIPLCIDARWLETGIGAYTTNLVLGLSRRSDIQLSAITLPKHQAALREYSDNVNPVDASMYSLKEQFSVPRAIGNQRMLHVPHYNVPLLYKGTLLVTIHDLTHVLDAGYRYSPKSVLYARPMLRLAARKAAHIFTVSQYSKRRIVERLGVPEEKVTVIYNGIGRQFYPEPREEARQVVRDECGVERPYILYVGNLKPHKNVESLLKCFALLVRRGLHDCELLIAGDDPLGAATLKQLAERLGVASLVRLAGRIDDRVLRCAYSAAELTVLPSFEEGFGLPIIESMACGTPVACSESASLPEIGGDAALYFSPWDQEEMVAVIDQLLHQSELRDRCRALGLVNLRRFDWSECVNSHAGIYRQFGSTLS